MQRNEKVYSSRKEMVDDQISERINSGDVSGAVTLILKEAIPAVGTGAKAVNSRVVANTAHDAVTAAQEFSRLHPDYADTQVHFDLMNWVIGQRKLDPAKVADLSRAWAFVKQMTKNDPKPADTARPRQAPAATPVAQAPEPIDPVELEARRLINEGRVTRESINAMSSAQYARACSSAVFNKLLELLEPHREPTPLTQGELQTAIRQANLRQTKGETVLTADVIRAVEESKRTHWTSVYQDPPPMPSPTDSSRSGVLNSHRGQGFAKPLPSLQTCLTQEEKDHAWIEETRNKSARAIRVRAHKSR